MQILKSFFKALGSGIKFINTYFKTFVLLLLVVWLLSSPSQNTHQSFANLERIDLKGEIFDVNLILEKISEVKNNPQIKGVLLVIDSPGGAFAPSMELALAIKDLKAQKPVIAYAAGTMASGSYLAGVSANKIIANPASFIGSIGVIMQSADISELANKLGIKEQTISAGEFKQAGTFTRAWSEKEREYLQDLINQSYTLFTDFVSRERKLKSEEKTLWADARVFLAQRAKNLGLIDSVGNYELAKKELEKLADVKEPIWKEREKKDKIDEFLDKLSETGVKIFTTTLSNFINTQTLKTH